MKPPACAGAQFIGRNKVPSDPARALSHSSDKPFVLPIVNYLNSHRATTSSVLALKRLFHFIHPRAMQSWSFQNFGLRDVATVTALLAHHFDQRVRIKV